MGNQGQERRPGVPSRCTCASAPAASFMHSLPPRARLRICTIANTFALISNGADPSSSDCPPQFPVHPKQEKAAAAEGKAPKFYPSEDAPVPLKRRNVLKPTRLRPSITPGTVRVDPPCAGSFLRHDQARSNPSCIGGQVEIATWWT